MNLESSGKSCREIAASCSIVIARRVRTCALTGCGAMDARLRGVPCWSRRDRLQHGCSSEKRASLGSWSKLLLGMEPAVPSNIS